MYETRLRRLLLAFHVLLGVIGARAFALQVLGAEYEDGRPWASMAAESHEFVVHPRRGEILWADGTKLAWNQPTYGLEILWGEVDHRIVPTLDELRAAYPPDLSGARRTALARVERDLARIAPKLLRPRRDSLPQYRWRCRACATQRAWRGVPTRSCGDCGSLEYEEVPPLLVADLASVLELDVHRVHLALVAALRRWELNAHWRSHAFLVRIGESAVEAISLYREPFAGFRPLPRNGRDVDPAGSMIAGGTRLPSADEAEALAAECREELQVPSVDAAVFFPTLVGSSFLEQHHDRALRGYPGRSERVVRAERAFEREVRVVRPVVDGEDLRTTLRRDLQRTALEIVAAAPEGGHGAAVVLDVRTGAVVALASTDRDGLDHARSHVIPGSVYKLVTAVALLESGHAPTETLSCEGSARIAAGGRYVCHNRGGDGEIALHRAFVRSCNGYFAQQAVASGADALLDAATRLGLGARPLLDTFGARCSTPAGLECSRPAVHPDKWKVWDLAQIGIGQGAASASPLQIAVAYARIASGGRVLHPWLLERDRPPAGTIPVDPVLARWAPILRAAARGVVDDSGDGTASGQSALVALRAAGKTGTADVRGPGGTTTNNTIFVGYAPHDDPRYCAVVAFQGMPERRYGGDAAAEPVARLLAEALRE